MYQVSVLIPCYNEEANIEECVMRIPELPWNHEIVVIDDGSNDDTFSTARRIDRKNLSVLGYRRNRGKGHAVRYGVENCRGEVAVIQDADMATPPEELEDILRPIMENRADFVNGTRMKFKQERGAMKGVHFLGNMIFAFIVSTLIRKKLTDTLCGFKAFRVGSFRGRLSEDTWPDFELLLKAKKLGMRITEVPIHYKRRHAGKSKMKTFGHALKMSRILMKGLVS